ncbi:V-set domain-containing T-cell activation inhibitor 1 [Aulostomus maculatus]
MATLGRIIFYSMVTLIIIFSIIIILILALTFSGSSSELQSSNRFPIANLSEDKLLSCFLHQDNEDATFSRMSVTWEKAELTGVVYKYENGAEDFTDQNSDYRGRTQLFPDALNTGNVSLLLKNVKYSDEGEYTCQVSYSRGGGKINIHLKTAAFSAPTFTFSNGILTAEANRWFPKPNVTWLNYDDNVLQGSTNFTLNSAGTVRIVTKLQPVNTNNTYTCKIQNDLVTSVSDVTVTGSDVSGNTYFIYSTATSLPAFYWIVTNVLCIYYLT